MPDVVDLNAERDKRFGPDAEFVQTDGFGRKLFSFLLSYEMDDTRWSTQVWASSFEDAEKRVAAMRASLKVDGQAFTTVPA